MQPDFPMMAQGQTASTTRALAQNRVLRNTYMLLALSLIPTIAGAWLLSSPAGSTIGQASTHFPHFVQVSRMSSTRACIASRRASVGAAVISVRSVNTAIMQDKPQLGPPPKYSRTVSHGRSVPRLTAAAAFM